MPMPIKTCPDPEGIAAFIDGRVTPEERREMAAHLADCEACYEVFTEALVVQEELAGEAPEALDRSEAPAPLHRSESPQPRSWLRSAMRLAAGLLFALLAGYFLLAPRLGPGTDSGRLVAEFQLADGSEPFRREGWSAPANPRRGPDSSAGSAEAVLVGTRLLNLRLALALGDRREGLALLSQLADWRGDLVVPTAEFGQMREELERGAVPAELVGRLEQREKALLKAYRYLPPLETGLLLGRWAEAGRQACRARDKGPLSSRAHRRLTDRLLAGELSETAREKVEEISRQRLTTLDPGGFAELQKKYEDLLELELRSREEGFPF